MKVLETICSILILVASGLQAGAGGKPLLKQPNLKELSRVNPFDGQQAAERAGHKLFERECSSCHGHQAEGHGRAPALASDTIRQAPAGAIFWILRNGSLRRGMPSFSHLPEAQRWQIVTYLKTPH